jgi:hypothetical protein
VIGKTAATLNRPTGPKELMPEPETAPAQQKVGTDDKQATRLATETTLDHRPPDGMAPGPVSATPAMPPGMFTSKSSAYASWAARWKANQAELAGKNAEPARPEAGTVRQRPPLLERMREALPEDQRAKVDVATTKAAAMARTLKLEGDHAGS